MTFEEDFFLTVVGLNLGGTTTDLVNRLGMDPLYLSRLFTTWVTSLLSSCPSCWDETKWSTCCWMLQRSAKFYSGLQRTGSWKVIQARKETFSNYKSRDTLKGLVDLFRNLTVNFVSPACGGHASDKHNTLDWRLLDLLKYEDSAMADHGHPVSDELRASGLDLITQTSFPDGPFWAPPVRDSSRNV